MANNKSVARAGIVIAAGVLLSRILGFARAILLAYAIGITGLAANAFATSMRIPNTIYTLIISGALTAVLVPQITKAALAKDKGQAYVNKLVTLGLVATLLILPIIAVASPYIVNVLGAGWNNSEQTKLAVIFSLFLLPQIIFFTLYTVLGEVLNAKKYFGPYAWSPVLNNAISIAGLIAFILMYGSDPEGSMSLARWDITAIILVAGSATFGVAAQGLVLFIFWKKIGLKYKPDFKFRGVGLGTMGKVAFWTLMTVIITQITALVYATILSFANASGVPGLAAWDLVTLISLMPHAVIVMSIVTVNFTRMSESVHQGNMHRMKEYLGEGVRLSLFFMSLVSGMLIVLTIPIFKIIQPTVNYSYIIVIAPLAILTFLNIVPVSFSYVLQRGFFSMSDTRTPFFILGLISLAVIGMAFVARAFGPVFIAPVLAAINIVSELIFSAVLFFQLRKRIGSFGGSAILKTITQTGFATVVSMGVGAGVVWALGGFGELSFAMRSVGTAFFTIFTVAAVMTLTYLAVLILVNNKEAQNFVGSLKTFVKRATNR